MTGVPSDISPSATPWRCSACHTLLGVAEGDHVEVRYKTAAYTIRAVHGAAELTTRCRRCGAPACLVCSSTAEPGTSE
ncbi:MAG: hypothetical protein RBU45_08410 [Myxococcota bacterium]|jgi:hypothetical protein|nr:hypothetical protein [Myxococcota bacterium]